MSETPMFVQAAPRPKEKAVWPFALAFTLLGLIWSAASAPAIVIDPDLRETSDIIYARLRFAAMSGLLITFTFTIVCIIFKRGVSAVSLLAVGAASFLVPLAAPFATNAIGGVVYAQERSILSAIDTAAARETAAQEARLAAADIGALLEPETFDKAQVKTYEARVQSYREATDALRSIGNRRESELEASLAKSKVPTARRNRMLDDAHARAQASASLVQALHSNRSRAADAAEAGVEVLARPNAWRMWSGQMQFVMYDDRDVYKNARADLRSNLAMVRRLEGNRGVIGASAQRRAS